MDVSLVRNIRTYVLRTYVTVRTIYAPITYSVWCWYVRTYFSHFNARLIHGQVSATGLETDTGIPAGTGTGMAFFAKKGYICT